MEFKIGDMVKWRSQAGGHWTEKRGKIVYTLQPHQNPISVWHNDFIAHRRMFDGLRPPNTNGLSYLVSVSDGDDRVPKLYMPRPASLELVPVIDPAMAVWYIKQLGITPQGDAKQQEPSIEDYERLIIQWATERGLLAGTTTEKQMFKLGEEFGEVFGAMLLEDLDKVKLELGDMMVVMANICGKLGITLKDCIGAAYEKIKNRKGRMVNGSFVKDE